jgi:hypothetical protein
MKLSVLSMMVLLAGAPFAAHAQDLDTDYQNLKDAEAKGDVAAVKKLAADTHALAKQAIDAPAPTPSTPCTR